MHTWRWGLLRVPGSYKWCRPATRASCGAAKYTGLVPASGSTTGFSIPVSRSLPEEPLASHPHRNPVQWDLQARPFYPALSNHWSTPLRSSPEAQSLDAQFRLQKYSLWEAFSPLFCFSGLHECSSNFSTRRFSCLLLINTQWLAHVAVFFP